MDPTTAAPRRGRGVALRALTLGLIAAFVALLVYGLVVKVPDPGIDDRLGRGQAAPAPGFELSVLQRGSLGPVLERRLGPALADGRLGAAELRGTPVVLNFWASWCDPCRDEAPLLEGTWRRARAGGVTFVGLNMQDLTGDARGFMREFAVSYVNVRDQSDAVARKWGVTGIPETFFLAGDGRIVGHVVGIVSADQLRDGIEAARAGRPLGTLSGGDRRLTR